MWARIAPPMRSTSPVTPAGSEPPPSARCRRGDWEGARTVQDEINTIVRIVLRFPCFPAIKEILRWRGIDCGPCIRPRGGLTPVQAADLRRQLDSVLPAHASIVSMIRD